ncbi:MAG: LysM peptidoglycan-binding domain-containing protein [Clostridia bacterium]|nr:LysM peptidoglycan-binding domain-containing protein [Clostridia bacterium]
MSQINQGTCAYTYTVKRGDSFYLIARRLGVPLRDLMNANPTFEPTRLMVGDVLCVPHCAAEETPAPEATPPVQNPPEATPPAENTPVTPIAPPPPETPPAFEGNTNGNTNTACPENRRAVIAEGQTVADLQIAYDKSYRTLEAANPNVDLQNLQAGQTVCIPDINLPCALPASIVMRDGETLSSIAVTYNLPVAQLLRANPCLAPDDFTAGTTVKLPQ